VDEVWPPSNGLSGKLKGGKLHLELAGEFRATVITLRRS
jgi:hypothetical protein